jgi:hypothetical protein
LVSFPAGPYITGLDIPIIDMGFPERVPPITQQKVGLFATFAQNWNDYVMNLFLNTIKLIQIY